jgi:thiol-disulfide isomerase/thioredoxin
MHTSSSPKRVLVGVVAAATLAGCDILSALFNTDYRIPVLSPSELSVLTDKACQQSTTAAKPVLVEFSADWCPACRTLAGIKTNDPQLAAELRLWALVEINIDDGEAHPEHQTRLGIDAIPTWLVVAPTDCKQPIWDWPRVSIRAVEPKAFPEDTGVSAASITEWLDAQRKEVREDRQAVANAAHSAPAVPPPPPSIKKVKLWLKRKGEVWLDNEKVGKIKTTTLELAPGKHKLLVAFGKKRVSQALNIGSNDLEIRCTRRSCSVKNASE